MDQTVVLVTPVLINITIVNISLTIKVGNKIIITV